MGYDVKKVFEKAKKMAKLKKCLIMEDVIAFTGIADSTFYSYYPGGSDELEKIKDILMQNRSEIKLKLRKHWLANHTPVTDIALYKLAGTREERMALTNTIHETVVENGGTVKVVFGDTGDSLDD